MKSAQRTFRSGFAACVLGAMTAFAPSAVAQEAKPEAPAETAAVVTDDAKMEEQYMAVATSRTKAELALRRLRKFLNDSKTTMGDIAGATEDARNKMSNLIQKAVQNEQKKAEVDRSQDVMADLMERGNRVNQDWQKFFGERAAIDARYQAAMGAAGAIDQAFRGATGMEGNWKDLDMDLTAVQQAYDALTTRAGGARKQAQEAIDALKAKQAAWEGELKKTTDAIGARAAETPTGAPSPL